jgi:hypothetical protein
VIVHGFVSIESSGGFGLAEDPAETYEQLIQMYLASCPGADRRRSQPQETHMSTSATRIRAGAAALAAAG